MTQHLCEVKKKYSLPRKVFLPEPKVNTETELVKKIDVVITIGQTLKDCFQYFLFSYVLVVSEKALLILSSDPRGEGSGQD